MSLLTSLVAHWSLAALTDDSGGNTLSNNGGVTFVAGKVGNCANFAAASSQNLQIADNANLSMGDINLTIAGWFYLATKPASAMTPLSKWNFTTANREYFISWSNVTDRFTFLVSPDGVVSTTVTANNLGAPTLATFYFLLAEHDAVNNITTIAANNGVADSAAHTTGVFNGTSTFGLGCITSAPVGNFWDGRIDQVGIWKRLLTASEKSALYNNGNGLAFADFATVGESSRRKRQLPLLYS